MKLNLSKVLDAIKVVKTIKEFVKPSKGARHAVPVTNPGDNIMPLTTQEVFAVIAKTFERVGQAMSEESEGGKALTKAEVMTIVQSVITDLVKEWID